MVEITPDSLCPFMNVCTPCMYKLWSSLLSGNQAVCAGRWMGQREPSYQILYPQQPKDGVSNVKLKFGTVTPLSRKKVIGLPGAYLMDKWPHGIAVVINNESLKTIQIERGQKSTKKTWSKLCAIWDMWLRFTTTVQLRAFVKSLINTARKIIPNMTPLSAASSPMAQWDMSMAQTTWYLSKKFPAGLMQISAKPSLQNQRSSSCSAAGGQCQIKQFW